MSLNCTISSRKAISVNTSRVVIYLCVLFMIALNSSLNAQTPSVSATECSCLNNASMPGNGQFEDVITILSAPGKTWEVRNVVGLFNIVSAPPPAMPIPIAVGQVITETSPGVYTLRVKRRDNTAWTIVFNDGLQDLPINALRRCRYPSNTIIGDKGVCVSKSRTYQLDIPSNLINNISWSITGPGTIIGSANSPIVSIQWPSNVGSATVNAIGSARSYSGQLVGLCNFNISNTVLIIDEPEPISLACNNSLNLTLDGFCEVEITPDMIMENISLPLTSYDVILKDIEADTLLPNAIVGMKYIGKRLSVSVYHDCSGNSCWGTVLVEDKSIPLLTCVPLDTIDCDQVDKPEFTGMPLPSTAFFMLIAPRKYKVLDFDYCSDVILEYNDEQITAHCHGGISAEFKRTWVATDNNGNSTSCEQIISVRQASLEDVMIPPSYDDVIGPNPSLDACGDWIKLPNGHPDPISTGYPTGALCANIIVDFEDIRFDICVNDKTFKIRRKWIVIDGCTGEQIQETQTITVMDTQAPVCTAPADFTVGTSDHTCVGNVNVPVPMVDDCIDWDYTIAYKPVDDSDDPYTDAWVEGILKVENRKYVITGLPEGYTKFWISYYIYDGCGNVTNCYTTVTINDVIEPIAVCKQYTFVGLNEVGMAWAGVESFDDGSHDNCMIDRIELRRMENFACGMNTTWDKKVLFCCEDVGKTIMVQMRVTDKSGNSNTCMVEVTVQDNTPPKFHLCPADTIINCDAELWDLSLYGQPTVKDSCGYTLKEEVDRRLNDCGIGQIFRKFIATDNYGNSATCTQIITVRPITPFNENDIFWPADYTFTNGCRAVDIKPEDLPADRRYPRFRDKACSKPAYDYDDIIFQYVDGACFKILREWTVIDWCQFDARAPYQISWKHTQVIKVINSVAPTITKGCNDNDLETQDVDTCKAKITIRVMATDDCPGAILTYGYEIDLFNNGTIDYNETGDMIMKVVPYGNHKVTWWVRDECGNVTRCTKVFAVKDKKAPTPICHTQVVSVVMPTTKQITIWAKDFIKEGYDNCTTPPALRYSFTSNVKDSSRVFTCEDFVSFGNTGIPVRIYIFDLEGNSDYCNATFLLQDNAGVCSGTTPGEKVIASGRIIDPDGRGILDADITMESDLPEFPQTIKSGANGIYAFENLKKFHDYLITPQKSGKASLGVNTLDILQIQKHILSLKKLGNNARMLAADVDGDQKVSISDIVYLRKLVLGVTSDFEKVPTWQFVTESSLKGEEMYPIHQTIFIPAMSRNETDQSFIGIKTGDIDGSYLSSLTNNQTDERSAKVLTFDHKKLTAGSQAEIVLTSSEIEAIKGLQFSFYVDPTKAKVLDIYSGKTVDPVHYFTNDGANYKVVWSDPKHAFADIIVSIELLKETTTSDVFFQTNDMENQLYMEDAGNITSHKLSIRSAGNEAQLTTGLRIYQNVPNPFTTETEISFEIDKEESVSLNVFNAEGKLLYTKTANFAKGLNSFKITEDDLKTKGILLYQILTKTHYSGRRMIKLF